MEKNTQVSTNKLFHYTNSIENLINILKKGFQVRYSLESLSLFSNPETDLTDEFAIPMICFCDIPLNLVKQHTSIYGNYAIGLSKEWGEKESICPILYLPKHGETKVLLESITKNIHKNNCKIREIRNVVSEEQDLTMIDVINLYDQLIDLTMYVKPYSGPYERKLIGFNEADYKFYDEREWRYKLNKMLVGKSFLTKQEYESFENVEERNSDLKYIPFASNDLSQIIVPAKDIERIKDEISKIAKFKDFDLGMISSIEQNYSA